MKNKNINIEERKLNNVRYETFIEASRRWLTDINDKVAPTTFQKYESALSVYISREFGETLIKDISTAAIERYIEEIFRTKGVRAKDGKKLKSGTLHFVRSVIKSVVAYSNGDKDFLESEIEHSDSTHYDALSSKELRRVCACAEYNRCPEMLAVLLMIYTGIRLGEICALCSDDFNADTGEIYIHRSVHRVRNRDESADRRTRNVISEIPTKKQIRYERVPDGLTKYIAEFAIPGTVLLTGEKEKIMEPKTLRNRIDRIFDDYRVERIPFQRFRKTYTTGNADTRILNESLGIGTQNGASKGEIDTKWLCREMVNDLPSLRMLLGLSIEETSEILGVKKSLYKSIEEGKFELTWNQYLTFLFFFHYNPKTTSVIDALGLYPKFVEEALEI